LRGRVTMLPAAIKPGLTAHVERVRKQHEADLRHGAGWVELPGSLARKYPSAGGPAAHLTACVAALSCDASQDNAASGHRGDRKAMETKTSRKSPGSAVALHGTTRLLNA